MLARRFRDDRDPWPTATVLVETLRRGELVLLTGIDRAGTECAVLAANARTVTPAAVNQMVTIGRGVVACVVDSGRAMRLGLEMIRSARADGIAYCRSVEAATGVSTGISAADRACTLNAIGAHFPSQATLVQPGHVMPNLADPDAAAAGMLPDAILDRLSTVLPVAAAAWCHVLDDAGNVASHRQAMAIADTAGVPLFGGESAFAC
ncbi:3,4-dihydroxy-2-butanone-4-phosphate synthase [Sphingomonas sp.]|uniref:3,4-dihydroxy-2-butanone-4-phosphate synthase n=1 Tax=Sphingomonas sp. TaxID=28214 RepID=UPI002DD62BF1|nr:3,4-dihydroxy-2-butanone-4-phosphate synthase [Sphingomonas sp.]